MRWLGSRGLFGSTFVRSSFIGEEKVFFSCGKGLCFGLLFWFSVCSVCWLRLEKSLFGWERLGEAFGCLL